MPKQIQLSIPTPCHENWDAMTPEKQGRFCSSCSKTVLDFTLMTDGQIVDAIKKAGENACGRFTNDQLNRPLQNPIYPKWYMSGMWKYALSSFLLFNGVQSKAQVKPTVTICNKPNDATQRPKMGEMITLGILAKPTPLKGKVLNENGIPLTNATITALNKKWTVKTDKNGAFSIQANIKQEVEVSAEGYANKKFVLKSSDNIIVLNALMLMGDMDIVTIAGGIRVQEVEAKDINNGLMYFSIKSLESGSPIPNATVLIKKDGKISGDIADTDGQFTIKRTKKYKQIECTISSVGFKAKTIVVKESDLFENLQEQEILLEREVKKGEEVVVTGYGFVKGGYSVMGSTKKMTIDMGSKKDTFAFAEKEIKNITKENMAFHIYPNPIAAGQSLQLQYKAIKEEMIMFQLTTLEGKTILLQKEKAVIGANQYNIQIPANIAAQTIVVQLINSVGKKVGTEKIVVL